MAVMERESWTDARLEDRFEHLGGEIREFRVETNRRFEQVDRRFEQVDKRFERIEERFGAEFVAVRREMKEGFDKLNRTLIWFAAILVVTLVANGYAS